MARTSNVLLMVFGCMILAATVNASCDDPCDGVLKYTFQFFEHSGPEVPVFGPEMGNGVIGKGYVYDNNCTKGFDPSSELYGYTGGMYFYSSKIWTHDISTIFFEDIGEKGGTFAEAELHLRGIWKVKENGDEEETQDIAIVGGVKGLAGAWGTVKYTKTGPVTWLVQGTVYVEAALVK